MQIIALFFLVTVAIGGVAWVFVYPVLSGERKAEKRQATVAQAAPVGRAGPARMAQKNRREQVPWIDDDGSLTSKWFGACFEFCEVTIGW